MYFFLHHEQILSTFLRYPRYIIRIFSTLLNLSEISTGTYRMISFNKANIPGHRGKFFLKQFKVK